MYMCIHYIYMHEFIYGTNIPRIIVGCPIALWKTRRHAGLGEPDSYLGVAQQDSWDLERYDEADGCGSHQREYDTLQVSSNIAMGHPRTIHGGFVVGTTLIFSIASLEYGYT